MASIIGIHGRKQSGKNTLARKLGYQEVALADELKQICAEFYHRVYNVPTYLWWGSEEEKSTDLGVFDYRLSGVILREVLVGVGTHGFRRSTPDIWIHALQNKIVELIDNGVQHIAITDIRFENEIDWVHEIGGHVIGLDRCIETSTCPSEQFFPGKCDRVILNSKLSAEQSAQEGMNALYDFGIEYVPVAKEPARTAQAEPPTADLVTIISRDAEVRAARMYILSSLMYVVFAAGTRWLAAAIALSLICHPEMPNEYGSIAALAVAALLVEVAFMFASPTSFVGKLLVFCGRAFVPVAWLIMLTTNAHFSVERPFWPVIGLGFAAAIVTSLMTLLFRRLINLPGQKEHLKSLQGV